MTTHTRNQYSSGKHRNRVTQSQWGNYRPQYLPLTNPANRVLAYLRGDDPVNVVGSLAWLDWLETEGRDEWGLVTQGEVAHARRVLTRLALLEKNS